MATPTAQAHIAAVITRLTNQLPAGCVVYDGDVPGTPDEAYVVVYADPGSLARSALTATSDVIDLGVQTTCVGSTARQAYDVFDTVRTALIDHVLAVAGRSCWPITQDDPGPPLARDDTTRDPAVNAPRFYLTPRFRVTSVTA